MRQIRDLLLILPEIAQVVVRSSGPNSGRVTVREAVVVKLCRLSTDGALENCGSRGALQEAEGHKTLNVAFLLFRECRGPRCSARVKRCETSHSE